MTGDDMSLTFEEALALARRLTADHLAEPLDWLDWGDVPELTENEFLHVVELAADADNYDRCTGIDSRQLKAKAS